MIVKTIFQEVIFNKVKASTLFELYTDPIQHEAATGAAAIISGRLGEPFNLYNGFCFGENIDLKVNQLIIQSWRTDGWPEGFDDSVVVIKLIEQDENTLLYLTHANVPSALAASLHNGWHQFYWNKWKAYLQIKNSSGT
ncbi:MAG: SRPBCC domain-containing protein [Chitinophagaceae bacterium]|nr:SRPBCC domain-containing protein [Chitinophagaceae bacterium]